MLKIHQPYKYKSKYILALGSIGVLLLGSLWFGCRLRELSSPATHPSLSSSASAAGDYRTIHDIENMQDMTQQICSNTEEGDTATLKDTRDPNSYTVVKLKDGNCWMQQNLKLGGSSTIELKSTDTDLAPGTTSWTLPASSDSSWSSSNTIAQIRVGKSGMTVSSQYPGDNNGWQSNYGNYYSWCAATAGTCSEYTNDGGNVSGSICPKNWHLPTGKSGGEFYTLFNGLSNTTVIGSPYNYPYAGFIFTGGLRTPGTDGYYWSSTSSSSSNAYALYFGSNGVFGPGASNGTRYFGYSVRCVASGGLDKIEKPIWTETADTGINVTVPKVLTLDVLDGVNTTADAYNVVTGEIVATVTSNNIDYEVLLSSEQPSLIGQKDSTNYIPVVSNTNPVEKGNNAWGILNSSNFYDPITTTPQQFYNTITTNDKSTSHTYGVGISISPTLPADTYSTTVTVTASSK